jgi:hypothetical protein
MGKSINAKVATVALAAVVLAAMGPLGGTAGAQSAPNAAPSNTQVPQPADQNAVNWPGAGYGVAALLGNVLYIPAKLVYATLGSVVGGGTYLVTAGNSQASNTVFRSALGGDYVLTPQMVAGQQPINFSGPTTTPPPVAPNSMNGSGSSSTMASTGSSNVQPIAPLPPTNVGPSTASSNGSGQPLDHGTGPTSNSIE